MFLINVKGKSFGKKINAMDEKAKKGNLVRFAVFTSGGDAQGMNAAVRAIVRTGLAKECEVFVIHEGYYGLVLGGNRIQKAEWSTVGGIMQRGGTVLGSARCKEFRTREGRLQAALNLIKHRINRLVVVGGDGSLTGANIFQEEWPSLLSQLVEDGKIKQKIADDYSFLGLVGLVGSIDNDMFGTDMTIGADSALHRITEAIDAISSTAASHQRTFVIKVMGRACGYLALMAGLSCGADWVLIPESPPALDNWEQKMVKRIKEARKAGRRESIVIVAEGARDHHGKTIESGYVTKYLEQHLGEEVRLTVLGHVQRGGAPSAFDRITSTRLGYAAVNNIIAANAESQPLLIGLHNNKVIHSPLMECVKRTQSVSNAIEAGDFERAMDIRGLSFGTSFRTFRTLVRSLPRKPKPGQKRLRLAIVNVGAPAPGINAAVRAAVRIGIDKGHVILGVQNGFKGFIEGDIKEMDWMSVDGWASRGGVELGINRLIPKGGELYAISKNMEEYQIQGLLIIGGWAAYKAAYQLLQERPNYPGFNVPIVCLPASINNNLPGSELSIGPDTALNNIVGAVDKIKQSAVATRRCFIVEVMGRYCGYLALMSGLGTGAEHIYTNENGITLNALQKNLQQLVEGFTRGKRVGLVIRNENANPFYTTNFISALFEEEGGDLFNVRASILGHLQQGGNPSPFDRIQATRFANRCINFLIEEAEKESTAAVMIGLQKGETKFHELNDFPRMVDEEHQRPKEQWWMVLEPIARLLS
ncbi:MAG: 6-phosphofructokinase [Marinifilaceae bacterium]